MKTRERILASAIDQITDFGVRHFTVDDLARRVGLSRVTIYRHFPSKDEVVQAALMHELDAFLADVDAAVAPYETLQRRLVEGFVFAVTLLRRHRALQRLVATEPELILPLLTTRGGPIVATGRAFIVRYARGASDADRLDDVELAVLAEILTRLIMSLVLTPESVVSLRSETELRAYAERYIAAVVGTLVRSDGDIASSCS